MEAIPKLPMICFDLKESTEPTTFGNLKRVSFKNSPIENKIKEKNY